MRVKTLGVALVALLGVIASFGSCTDSVSLSTDSRKFRLTATVAGYPSSPIKKVSGTNESFTIDLDISTINNTTSSSNWTRAYLYSYKVEIGSETLLEYTAPGNESNSHIFRRFQWDTTHFSHLSPLLITVTAKMRMERLATVPQLPNATGPTSSIVEQAGTDPMTTGVGVLIYNYAHLGQLYEFEGDYSPLQGVEQVFDNSNIGWSENDPANLERSLEGIRQSTIYYLYCHGNDGGDTGNPSFGAGAYEGLDPWFIYSRYEPAQPNSLNSNVFDQRVLAYGQGLPPMNFVFLDCCAIAMTSDAAEAFLWPLGGSLSYVVDRAFLSYNVISWTSWRPHFTPLLFVHLRSGKTVDQATTIAYRCLYDWAQDQPDGESVIELKSFNRNSYLECLGVYGDKFTRMRSLYTADNSEPLSDWFEVLYF